MSCMFPEGVAGGAPARASECSSPPRYLFLSLYKEKKKGARKGGGSACASLPHPTPEHIHDIHDIHSRPVNTTSRSSPGCCPGQSCSGRLRTGTGGTVRGP